MPDAVASPSEMFTIRFWDSNHDDRRGGYVGGGSAGVWFHKENAQAEADRRNAPSIERRRAEIQRDHDAAHARWVRAHNAWTRMSKEHEVLRDAGLRSADYSAPEPTFAAPEEVSDKELLDKIGEYWEVDSVDVNDALTETTDDDYVRDMEVEREELASLDDDAFRPPR